jgi:hypothetical protein
MRRRSYELLYALVAVVLITAGYLALVSRLEEAPAASGLVGHGLGIAGFLLMLMTETLYSLRKRSRRARWGRTSSWLRFHIFTGLVGPYMVLLHTAWRFQGLAGLVALMTAVVVLSGFVGRYIYTAVPRTGEGVELAAADLEVEIESAQAELERVLARRPDLAQVYARRLRDVAGVPEDGLLLLLGRTFLEWGYRLEWARARRRLEGEARAQAAEVEQLLRRRRTLQRQIASLATARRALATWHMVHIPLGMVLFTAAFVHVGAAIYYATLLR